MSNYADLKDFEGKHLFGGADIFQGTGRDHWNEKEENTFCRFCIDGVFYETYGDPDDGYRGYLESIKRTFDYGPTLLNHFVPVDIVYVSEKAEYGFHVQCDLIKIINVENDKIILELGTEEIDSYYPEYIIDYCPENL